MNGLEADQRTRGTHRNAGGSYLLDVDQATLLYRPVAGAATAGQPQHLQPMAARLLEIAAGFSGVFVWSAGLIERLWPNGQPENPIMNIRTHVNTLRAALAARGWPAPIETAARGRALRTRIPLELRHGSDPGARLLRDAARRRLVPPNGGRYVLDIAASTLSFDGSPHPGAAQPIPPTVRRLIEVLAGLRRDAVTVESVIPLVWPRDEPADPLNNLNVHLSRLRVLLASRGWPCPIGTLKRQCFRLVMPVEVRNAACPVLIPGELRGALRRLLYAHPDHAAAERFLELVGG